MNTTSACQTVWQIRTEVSNKLVHRSTYAHLTPFPATTSNPTSSHFNTLQNEPRIIQDSFQALQFIPVDAAVATIANRPSVAPRKRGRPSKPKFEGPRRPRGRKDQA